MSTVNLSEKYKTVWRRFWASLIDSSIFFPLMSLNETVTKSSASHSSIIWIVFYALLPYLYRILLHKKYGQTFGKMIMKVKVVDVSEAPLTFRQTILRDLVTLIFIALMLIPSVIEKVGNGQVPIALNSLVNCLGFLFLVWSIVDPVLIFSNDEHRTVHDFFADTVVIRTSS